MKKGGLKYNGSETKINVLTYTEKEEVQQKIDEVKNGYQFNVGEV